MNPDKILSECYDQFIEIKTLAEEQVRRVSEDRMDLFLLLASKRQGLQREINSNERRFRRSIGTSPPPPAEDRNRSRFEEISRIIRSIQDVDKKIEALVRERKERLLTEIKGLRHGRKAMKGYGGKSTQNARFIDKQG